MAGEAALAHILNNNNEESSDMTISKHEGDSKPPAEAKTMPRISQRYLEQCKLGSVRCQPSLSSSATDSHELITTLASSSEASQVAYGNMKSAARPYRSHKFPACSRCHKRRSRCTIERPGEACLLCRMHNVPCSNASSKKDVVTTREGFVRRSLTSENDYSSVDELSHVVGPIMSRDQHVLESYLPQERFGGDSSGIRVTNTQSNPVKPMYHAPAYPRRPGPTECLCSRNLPLDLLDKVEPFLDKLVALYFEQLHPCFPIVDENFIMTRIGDGSQLPQHFLCNFHAFTLFYWDLSPALQMHTRTDQEFAWQVAMGANAAEIQRCDLSIIISTSLNVAGRPSTSLVSNTVDVARTVALSHSIGLNHDCSDWKVSDEEKRVRHKAWWTVLIHDRWFNFATGTPPHITKGHYDAPIPTIEIIADGRMGSTKHVRAAECYIALCHLTEIIGDVLPLIYHIRSGNDGRASEQTSRSEIDLNRWVETLPAWLQLHEFDARPSIPGLVNLQLSYLAVRMLLRRIAWHEISQREDDPHSSWLLGCQAAADEIVRFITTLHQQDFRGFWLPYNAHHFTSALTLLLRCALQTSYTEVRQSCMSSARSLVDFLRKAKDECRWDLAETSLVQGEPVLKRIEDALVQNVATPLRMRHPPSYSPNDLSNGYSHDSSESVHNLNGNGMAMGRGQYLGESTVKETGATWQMSIEELFPEIFSDFSDTALFEATSLQT